MPPRWSRTARPCPGLRVEPLEDRSVPAVIATFQNGALSVALNAANDAATLIGTDAGGTTIDVFDGSVTQTFTGVTSVAVTDPGGNTGQQVTFAGDADGTINLTGAITVSGVDTVTVNGANGPVRAASFAAGGVSVGVRLNNGVTTTGAAGQSYAGPVVVGAPGVTLSAGAAGVGFSSTVNAATAGTDGLVVNAGGATDFGAAVGGASALASLITDGPGTTVLRGNTTTTGAQTFGDPVTVAAAAVTVASTGSGAVTFAGTVNGQDGQSRALTVNTAGATAFGAAVGGVVPLSALTTDAGGTAALAGNVTTSGSQTYGDPVTLSGAAVTLVSSGSGTIFFAGAIDGGTALTVNTGGTTTFGGNVGGTTALASLTTDAAGSTVIGLAGAAVQLRTTGGQTFNDPARLTGTTTGFTSTANGAVTFAGTLNGTAGITTDLTVTTGGLTSFGGTVGSTSPVRSLTTDAAGTTAVANNVTVSGEATFGDPVSVAPGTGVNAVSVTSQAGNLTFANTLSSASAAPLTLQAGADLVLRNNVFLTANGSTLSAQAAAAGPGRFTFADGIRVRADRQTWRAGDGAGGATGAAAAAADLVTNGPAFRDATDATAPRQFVLRQDAGIGAVGVGLPAAAQFGGATPADYKLVSDDGAVILNDPAAVAGPGTTALTLAAGTEVGLGAAINAPAAVVRLRAANGAITQTAGGITAAALAAQASAGIDLQAGGNAVAAFAARSTSGNVRFLNGVPFTVSTVAQDPVVSGLSATSGVAATAGTVVLGQTGASALDLTVAAPVAGGTGVAVVGGPGNDRLTVNYTLGATLANGLGFVGGAGGDTLTLTDAAGTAAHTYDVNNQVRRDNSQPVTYSDLEFLSITGGTAADTFNVTPAQQPTAPGNVPPTAGPELTLAGGGPSGTTGDALNFTVPAGTVPTFTSATGPDGIRGTAFFGGGGPPNPEPPTQSVAFSQMEAVNPQADIRVTVTGPGTAAPGGTATFTVVVTNLGPAAATGVRVTSLNPTGLTNARFTTTATAGATATPSQGAAGEVVGDDALSTLTIPANGSVTFTVTGTVGAVGASASLTATASAPGNALDPNAANNTAAATAPVQATALTAIGTGPGGGPIVKVFNADGSERFNFFAYDPAYRGGVTVATGDVTGDGVEDIVTGSATGGSHVKVFSGADASEVASFFAFPGFFGGVNVAVAGGRVVAGAGAGGGPVVKGFDPASGFAEVFSFFAYDPLFRGGVTVAGQGDLIATGAGEGGGPHVKVFRAADLSLVSSFFAFPGGGGVNVGMGLRGTTPVVVAGAGAGAQPTVVTFDAQTATPLGSVLAYESTFRGGVRVAGTTTAAGQPATVVGAGVGGSPRVRVFTAANAVSLDVFAFDPAFTGGVYVG